MLSNAWVLARSRTRLAVSASALALCLLSCGNTTKRNDQPAADLRTASQAGPRRITTGDGIALHVDVAGSGPPCLYVHGGPGQGAQSFQHMRGDALQSFLRMIYVDQRGSGQSESADDYRLDRIVDDFEDVRRALGLDKIYVLAHSFGGILAFRYVEKYPEHVRGLILANATLWFPGSLRSQLAYLREQLDDRVRTPDDAPWDVLNADYQRVRLKLQAKPEYVKLLAEEVQTMRALNLVDADPPRNHELGAYISKDPRARSEYDADFTLRTPGVQSPVLIITGDRDHAIGPEHYQRFRFPHQTVHRIDGSHLLYYENSAEFVEAIRGWITSLDAPSGPSTP
jgi:proline iminopeptidase